MKILAVVTARKSSKRLPCKNFRRLCGQSLTERAVAQAAAARERGVVRDVVLSTDSAYLLEQCGGYALRDVGLRPARLAGDHVGSLAVLLDVLDRLREAYDAVMVLQPTSPLRTVEDIAGAAALFAAAGGQSLITASPVPNGTVNGLYLKQAGSFEPVSPEHNSGKRHQDLAPVYLRNGAIFLSGVPLLRAGHIFGDRPAVYEMPWERSIDVDDAGDLAAAERYLRRQGAAPVCRRAVFAGAEQALDMLRQARRQGVQPIVPAVFRRWLGRHGALPAQTLLEWCDRHVYFDGTAVLADGEPEAVADADTLRSSGGAAAEPLLESYLQEKAAHLAGGADSLILEPES